MQNIENFPNRVFNRTGVNLRDMDVLVLQDGEGIPGHIFCREGDNFVVGVGYPTLTEEGDEIYTEFLHCIIAEDGSTVFDDVRWSSGPEEVISTNALKELVESIKKDGETIVFPHILRNGDVIGFLQENLPAKVQRLEAEVKRLRELL